MKAFARDALRWGTHGGDKSGPRRSGAPQRNLRTLSAQWGAWACVKRPAPPRAELLVALAATGNSPMRPPDLAAAHTAEANKNAGRAPLPTSRTLFEARLAGPDGQLVTYLKEARCAGESYAEGYSRQARNHRRKVKALREAAVAAASLAAETVGLPLFCPPFAEPLGAEAAAALMAAETVGLPLCCTPGRRQLAIRALLQGAEQVAPLMADQPNVLTSTCPRKPFATPGSARGPTCPRNHDM